MISPDTLDLKPDINRNLDYSSENGYFFIYNPRTHYPTLSGNTTPTYRSLSNGWNGGFASKFTGKSQEDLDKMLIKPPGENENGQTQIKEEKISKKIS